MLMGSHLATLLRFSDTQEELLSPTAIRKEEKPGSRKAAAEEKRESEWDCTLTRLLILLHVKEMEGL